MQLPAQLPQLLCQLLLAAVKPSPAGPSPACDSVAAAGGAPAAPAAPLLHMPAHTTGKLFKISKDGCAHAAHAHAHMHAYDVHTTCCLTLFNWYPSSVGILYIQIQKLPDMLVTGASVTV